MMPLIHQPQALAPLTVGAPIAQLQPRQQAEELIRRWQQQSDKLGRNVFEAAAVDISPEGVAELIRIAEPALAARTGWALGSGLAAAAAVGAMAYAASSEDAHRQRMRRAWLWAVAMGGGVATLSATGFFRRDALAALQALTAFQPAKVQAARAALKNG